MNISHFLSRHVFALSALLMLFPSASLQAAPTDQEILDAYNMEAAKHAVLDAAAWDQIAAALVEQSGSENMAQIATVLAGVAPSHLKNIARALAEIHPVSGPDIAAAVAGQAPSMALQIAITVATVVVRENTALASAVGDAVAQVVPAQATVVKAAVMNIVLATLPATATQEISPT